MRNDVSRWLGLGLLLGVLASAAPSEVNLARAAQRGVPSSGDSLDGSYRCLAGAFCDGSRETAWVTGAGDEHWGEVTWRYNRQTVARVTLDFAPFTTTRPPFNGYLPAAEVDELPVTTVLPVAFEVTARVGQEWRTLHAWDAPMNLDADGKAEVVLGAPLPEVDVVRLRVRSPAGQAVAVREWGVWGPAPATSFAFQPKWKALWIWGELQPVAPAFGPTHRYFRHCFTLEKPVEAAFLMVAIHDRGTVWLNGTRVATVLPTGPGMNGRLVQTPISPELLKQGANLLAVEGMDLEEVGLRAVAAELWIRHADGTVQTLATTPATWLSLTYPEAGWNTDPAPREWPASHAMSTPNQPVSSAWGLPYTRPFGSDEARVTGCRLEPAQPQAGERVKVTIDLELTRPLSAAMGAVLDLGEQGPARADDMDFWRGEFFLPPEQGLPAGASGARTIVLSGLWPSGMPPGMPLILRLCNPGGQVTFAPGPVGTVTGDPAPGRWRFDRVPERPAAGHFADVRIDDRGRLLMDGRVRVPVLYTASNQTPDRYEPWLASGINLFRIVPQGGSRIATDPDAIEARIDQLLSMIEIQDRAIRSVDPQAKYFLMLALDMPTTWKAGHPEDLIQLGDERRLVPMSPVNHSLGYVQETPDSPAMLDAVRTALSRFFTRLKASPAADAIAGVALCHGRAGENYWGLDANFRKDAEGHWVVPDRDHYMFGDFGVSARRNLRDWLQARYASPAELSAAWHVPGMAFDDVVNPGKWPAARFLDELLWRQRPEGRFVFRDRLADGAVYHDFVRHQNEARARLYLEAAHAIKEASDGRLLIGGYIGYVVPALTNSPPGSAQHCGHLATAKLLASPDIDFMCSPHFYHMRRYGQPIMAMGVEDSLRLHGKLWFQEYDTRTYLSAIGPKTFSEAESVEVMRKEFAHAVTRRQGWWWLDFSRYAGGPQAQPWFASPTLQHEAALMRRLYEQLLALPGGEPASEIAIIVNVEQPYHTDSYSPANTISSSLVNYLLPRFKALGAPVDTFAQSDLPALVEKGWLARYKLVVFLNAFHLDTAERELIEKAVKRDGRRVLWVYAPGYQGNPGPDSELALAGIEQTTGLQGVRLLPEEHLLGIRAGDDVFEVRGWFDETQLKYYTNVVGPVFWLDPKSANDWQTIATLRLDETDQPERVAVARRQFDTWTSWYATVPDLPESLLSRIVADSGVHLYTPAGSFVEANDRLIGVHTTRANPGLTIAARAPATWIDPFAGKIIARDTARITVPVKVGETKVYLLQQNAEWAEFVQGE